MSTKNNIIANVGGRVFASLMSFVFVPFYIKYLGMESFGLIGFFSSIQAIFFLLDAGMSTTINREMAILSGNNQNTKRSRDLLRTFEIIYWGIGFFVAVVLAISAPIIARDWLKLSHVPFSLATIALELMALTALFRWPVSIYAGALMGIRRHVPLNIVIASGGLLQGGGGVLVLRFIDPSITAFFLWQVLASAVTIFSLAYVTWRYLPSTDHTPIFNRDMITGLIGFSAGVTGITFLSIILTQSDKFLLSKMLSLEQFGYYALSGGIAAVFTTAAGAIYGVIFPSFAQALAAGDQINLTRIYHNSCQLLSLIVIPAGITVIMFSPELLYIYLGNSNIANNTSDLLRLMTVGNILLSIMMPPLAMQLSHGWTSLSLFKNLIAVIILIPSLFFMVSHYGASGAAIVWIVLNLGYFIVEVQIMHQKVLVGEQWKWYLFDIGIPVLMSVVFIGILRILMPSNMSSILTLFVISLAAGASVVSSALIMTGTRNVVLDLVGKMRAVRLSRAR